MWPLQETPCDQVGATLISAKIPQGQACVTVVQSLISDAREDIGTLRGEDLRVIRFPVSASVNTSVDP